MARGKGIETTMHIAADMAAVSNGMLIGLGVASRTPVLVGGGLLLAIQGGG